MTGTGVPSARVIGLGQACLDYLGQVPFFPREDRKIELRGLRAQCGGPASTALVALARLGVATAFLGSISDDPLGLEILAGLREEGVNAEFLKITPGRTSQFAFIAVTEGAGHRTIFWHRGSAPPLRPEEVDLSPFTGAEVLHLDGLMIEASLEAARQARHRGLRVVMDAGTMREGSQELASLVDVLIASERFADPLLGPAPAPEEALKALCALGPGEVVMTLGREGSVGWDGRDIYRQKAFPVQAVDTTGAGDVYHGAYIYGLLQGWSMPDCMGFSSAVSAMKCRQIGARRGIPRLPEIKAFLRERPALGGRLRGLLFSEL